MALFKQRVEPVHAVQWADSMEDRDVFPGPVNPIKYALTYCGAVQIKPGDWLVRAKPCDRPTVIPGDVFRLEYERVP